MTKTNNEALALLGTSFFFCFKALLSTYFLFRYPFLLKGQLSLTMRKIHEIVATSGIHNRQAFTTAKKVICPMKRVEVTSERHLWRERAKR